ncbi:MAG: hypothetical protein NVSMB14_15440 [Isosphaeraceae bacterium]
MGRLRPEFARDELRSFSAKPIVIFYWVNKTREIVEIVRIIDGRRDLGTVFSEDV